MDSDIKAIEPELDAASEEVPALEVVEGDAQEVDRSIVSTENSGVLVPYEEPKPRYVEPEQPAYKNRALIAMVFALVGIVAGRLTMEPKETVRIVEKPTPAITNAEPPKAQDPVIVVVNPFRTLATTDEFDPWQPLNGGFPIPPKEVELAIAARSGYVAPPANLRGSGFAPSGPIEPWDPGIQGNLPNVGDGGATPLPHDPVAGGGNNPTGTKPPVGQAGGKDRYVAYNMNGPAPESGQKSLLSIAAGAGGTGRSFVHYGEDANVESHGVLLIVPAGQYEAVVKKIEALGGAEQEGNYEGDVIEQQSRIQGMFVTRLAKLNEKRKDLLVDFLEDAQPVKQVNEAIDQETRAVSATRLPGGITGKAVIRVLLK